MEPDTTMDENDKPPTAKASDATVTPVETVEDEEVGGPAKIRPPAGKGQTDEADRVEKGKSKKGPRTYKFGDVVDGKILGYDGKWRLRRRIFPSPRRMPSAKEYNKEKTNDE